jgi:fused signal recognition particle receptor
LDELEDILIQSDVGVTTTLKIIKALEARTAKEKYLGNEDLMQMMQEEILTLLVAPNTNLDQDIQIESKKQPPCSNGSRCKRSWKNHYGR